MNPTPKKKGEKTKTPKSCQTSHSKAGRKASTFCLTLTKKRLKSYLNSIGHHIEYRALIQLVSSHYDKYGQVAGEVTQADVDDNLKRLARLNKPASTNP